MARKRKVEKVEPDVKEEAGEDEPAIELRRSKRSRTQIKYEPDPEDEPSEEYVPNALEEEDEEPSRSRRAPKTAPKSYSGSFKNSKVLTRAPKSIQRTEGNIAAVKFNDAVPVDSECPLKETFKVYSDTKGDHFHAMLNQTNIANNNNKYYLCQLLEHRKGEGYAVWFRWGRVGRIAGTTVQSYSPGEQGLRDGLNDFCKKFCDKTKNDWYEKSDFQKVPGKYDLVAQDFGANIKPEVTSDLDEKIKVEPSKLEAEIQELINMICDVSMMESYAKEMKFDIERAPLGKLTEQQLQNGIKILKQIEDAIRKTSKRSLSSLSSQFYTRVPHDFGFKRPPVITELETVHSEYELLESLRQITIAINVKEEGADHIDPTTKAFNNLNSSIEVSHGADVDFVAKLLEETHGSTHNDYTLQLETLYRVHRQGEEERFNSKVGNNALLWHGSRTSNFAGIIKNGLRIAPPEAPVTGYMFGKGVYFADSVSKSANYCHASHSDPRGLLILCKVGLGKQKIVYSADSDLPKSLGKHNSIKAVGRNVPSKEEKFESSTVPCGDLVTYEKADLCSLLYNEYVVYDTSQIEIVFIAKVKFEYGESLW